MARIPCSQLGDLSSIVGVGGIVINLHDKIFNIVFVVPTDHILSKLISIKSNKTEDPSVLYAGNC